MDTDPQVQQNDMNAMVPQDNEDNGNDSDDSDIPDVNQNSYKTDRQRVNKGTKFASMPPTDSKVLAEL